MTAARRSRRFPFEWALSYRSLDYISGQAIRGTGRTIEISSTGVLFTTEHQFSLGQSVELSIAWPILRYGSVPVTLTVVGEVIRTESGMAAVEVARRKFLADQAVGLGDGAQATPAWVM